MEISTSTPLSTRASLPGRGPVELALDAAASASGPQLARDSNAVQTCPKDLFETLKKAFRALDGDDTDPRDGKAEFRKSLKRMLLELAGFSVQTEGKSVTIDLADTERHAKRLQHRR